MTDATPSTKPQHTPSSKTRRVRVHRRRSKARILLTTVLTRLAQAALLFLTAGLLLDLLSSRQLTPHLQHLLAAELRTADTTHARRQAVVQSVAPALRLINAPFTQSIDAPSGIITRRSILYWSPVESLTLVEYPPLTAPTVLPLSWSHLTIRILSGTLSVTPLRSSTPILPAEGALSIPRLTPVSLHTAARPALVLEHASGFMPARMLQSALYAAVLTGDLRPPLAAPSCIAWEMIGYANRQALPDAVGSVSKRLAVAGGGVQRALDLARAVAEDARERRKNRRLSPASEAVVPEAAGPQAASHGVSDTQHVQNVRSASSKHQSADVEAAAS